MPAAWFLVKPLEMKNCQAFDSLSFEEALGEKELAGTVALASSISSFLAFSMPTVRLSTVALVLTLQPLLCRVLTVGLFLVEYPY